MFSLLSDAVEGEGDRALKLQPGGKAYGFGAMCYLDEVRIIRDGPRLSFLLNGIPQVSPSLPSHLFLSFTASAIRRHADSYQRSARARTWRACTQARAHVHGRTRTRKLRTRTVVRVRPSTW